MCGSRSASSTLWVACAFLCHTDSFLNWRLSRANHTTRLIYREVRPQVLLKHSPSAFAKHHAQTKQNVIECAQRIWNESTKMGFSPGGMPRADRRNSSSEV